MAAEGMDLSTVIKVPQLHLARLDRKDGLIFGCRVINRTLGTPQQVCGKLFDRALQDIGDGTGARARSTVHGLSSWVMNGLQRKISIGTLAQLQPAQLTAVGEIARGDAGVDTYDLGRESWEKLVAEFIEHDQEGEAALYRSKGGKLLTVEHMSDQSEYADTSAGSMALFTF
jgi:hypothetical protein